MNSVKVQSYNKTAGFLAIASVILVIISQSYLQSSFDWEGAPLETVFALYQYRMPWIKLIWFIFAAGSIMIAPTAILFHVCFGKSRPVLSKTGTCFGIIAAFSYTIGIMRWVLLADALSADYAVTKDPLLLKIFSAFNIYAGNGFGETIAPLSHSVWIICLGVCMFFNNIINDKVTKVFALLFILFGFFIGMRPAEYIGLKFLGKLSDLALMIWAVAFLLYGVYMYIGKKDLNSNQT